MRSRFASLFVLRCRVLQSPGQHSFLGEQVQGKCWNAIKQPWLVFSCHCHVKAFVKLQMCLRACSSTCQVEDIAQQFYVSEEVKASIKDHREIVLKAERLRKSCPVLQLNFKCSNMSQTHDISRQLNALTHWANPSKLNDSMSRIVKGPIFIYFYHMPTWMHPFELASCTWYSLCCYMYTAWDACVPWCLMQSHLTCSNFSTIDSQICCQAFLAIVNYSYLLHSTHQPDQGESRKGKCWNPLRSTDSTWRFREAAPIENGSPKSFYTWFLDVSRIFCECELGSLFWAHGCLSAILKQVKFLVWNRYVDMNHKKKVVPHKAVAEVSRREKL